MPDVCPTSFPRISISVFREEAATDLGSGKSVPPCIPTPGRNTRPPVLPVLPDDYTLPMQTRVRVENLQLSATYSSQEDYLPM